MGSGAETIVDETVDIDAGDFWDISFEAQKGDTITVAVWELDGYDFDVFILRDGDVDDNWLLDDHALLAAEREIYCRRRYPFPETGVFHLVVSCIRAREVPREVHVKITRERKVEKVDDAHPVPMSRGALEMSVQSSSSGWSHRGMATLLAIVVLLISVTVVAYIVHPGLGAAVVLVSGLLGGLFRKEIRGALGLHS